MTRRLAATCIAAWLGSLVPAAGAQAPSAPPDVHVGDTWTIRVADGFTKEPRSEATQRVVDLSDREIVVQSRNHKTDKVSLRYFNRDWNVLDSGDTKYDPYYPEYRFPMSPGLAWQSDYTATAINGDLHNVHVAAKIAAFEKVEVAAGSFDAYRIELNWESRGTDTAASLASGRVTTWYAPAARRFVRRETTVYRDGRVRDKTIEEVTTFTLEPAPASPAK